MCIQCRRCPLEGDEHNSRLMMMLTRKSSRGRSLSASVASCDVSSKYSASCIIKRTDDCKYFDGDHSDERDNDEEDNDGDLKLMACHASYCGCHTLHWRGEKVIEEKETRSQHRFHLFRVDGRWRGKGGWERGACLVMDGW